MYFTIARFLSSKFSGFLQDTHIEEQRAPSLPLDIVDPFVTSPGQSLRAPLNSDSSLMTPFETAPSPISMALPDTTMRSSEPMSHTQSIGLQRLPALDRQPLARLDPQTRRIVLTAIPTHQDIVSSIDYNTASFI